MELKEISIELANKRVTELLDRIQQQCIEALEYIKELKGER